MATTRLEWAFRALGALPLLLLGVMLSEALYLRLVLGRFPVYPESIDGLVVVGFTVVQVGLFWTGLLGWPLLLVIPLGLVRAGRWKQIVAWPILFVLGICAIVLVWTYDPTTFSDWFWD